MYANVITHGRSPFRPLVSHSHTFRKTLSKKKMSSREPLSRTPTAEGRTNIVLVAVEDGLVAADLLRYVREGLYHAKAELLPLHLGRDGDVLDVSDATEPAQKFALEKDAAGAHDAIGLALDDDEDVVRRRLVAHGPELSRPRLCAHVRRLRQHGEHGEVPAIVVGRSQWAHLVEVKKHPRICQTDVRR